MTIQGARRIATAPSPAGLPSLPQAFAALYSAVPSALPLALVALYSAGLVTLLVRAALAWGRMRRLGSSGAVITDRSEARRLCALGHRLGLRQKVRLAASGRVACPTLVGVWAPTIVLPRGPDSGRVSAGVLLHELAHIRAHSVLYNLVGRLALALHWFNPLVWLAVRYERQAGEQVCDDWATCLSRDWRGYAHALLDAAASIGATRPCVAAAHFVRPTGIAARIARIRQLQDGASPNRGTLQHVLAVGLGMTCVAVLGAARLQAVSTSTPPVDLSLYAEDWEFEWLPAGVLVSGGGHAMNAQGQIAGKLREGDVSQSCRWSPSSTDGIVVGDVSSHSSAISSEGIVAGVASTDDTHSAVPYIWREGELALLPTLHGPWTAISDVNNRGQVVGQASRADTSQAAFIAWEDSIVELPTLGGRSGRAMAITEEGAVVGRSSHSDGTGVPFYWHPESGVQELWYPPRWDGGSARDITEDGRVLVDLHECDWGEEWDSGTCLVLCSPFLWTFIDRKNPDGHWFGGYEPLPKPPGYDDVRGHALNARGDVLLSGWKRETPRSDMAYFLIADGELIKLPQPAEGGRMRYHGLNDRGWLAGNLTVPQQDGHGKKVADVEVGFIAKPRGR